MTNVIAAIAATDETFATSFVKALLAQAAEDCTLTAEAQKRLGPVPARLVGDRERRLFGEQDEALGIVDLIFEEPGDNSEFTLLVENKLYSGFGPEQLSNYRAAVVAVRQRGGRGGLIAVTRDVPAHGVHEPTEEEWLGSVRWARLLGRLRALDIADPGVKQQWHYLLDVLDEQGDLGMTTIDPGAVRAWARYEDGREALRRLLEQVHDATLAHTQQELKRYRSGLKPPDLAAAAPGPLFPRGLYEVRFGLSVPAAYTEQSLQVACWPEDGVPYFGLVVIPRDGANLLDEGNRKLQRHVKALLDAGFIPNVGPEPSWYSRHAAEAVIASNDAPAALVDLMKADITTVVNSGILRYDVTEPLPHRLRRKKLRK